MRGQCERAALYCAMTGGAECDWRCDFNQRTRRTVQYYSADQQRWIDYFLCECCQESIQEQVETYNPTDRDNFRGLFTAEEETQ